MKLIIILFSLTCILLIFGCVSHKEQDLKEWNFFHHYDIKSDAITGLTWEEFKLMQINANYLYVYSAISSIKEKHFDSARNRLEILLPKIDTNNQQIREVISFVKNKKLIERYKTALSLNKQFEGICTGTIKLIGKIEDNKGKITPQQKEKVDDLEKQLHALQQKVSYTLKIWKEQEKINCGVPGRVSCDTR